MNCQFRLLVALWLVLAVWFLNVGTGLAQTTNGSFRGTVTDQSGGAAPRARLRVTNVGTGVWLEAVANESGEYVVPNVPPGDYNIRVSLEGFETLETRGVTLLVNQTATLDFTIKPGSVTQEVTVTGEAPLANTTNATVGTVIATDSIVQLPLNGRQFTQLTLLTPGAAPQGSGQQAFFEIHSDYGAISPAVNGARPEMNNFTIDGVEDNELFFNFAAINPPPDALREFNVQTNMSSGQYGRAAGANVNVVTQSGGNQFHGSAWEFLRNTDLDARNFFNPTVSIFHQNQFGGTLGGPILKNKLWGFGWYEGFRKTLGSTILELVPTSAQLQGNLSGLQQIYNPYTTRQTGTDAQGNPVFARDPFAGNQIPTGQLNPTALAVANLIYPQPNYTGNGVNYLDSEPVVTSTNQYGIRIDAALSTKSSLFGRYSQDVSSRVLPTGIPKSPTDQRGLARQAVVGYTRTFGPSAVLEIRGQYLRTEIGLLGFFPPTSFLESNGLLKDWPAQTGLRPVLPGFSISDAAGVPGTPQSLPGDPINNWEYSGTFTKVLSKHTITAGASLVHTWVLDNCTYASASFNNLPTSDPQNSSSTGSGLASYLLGIPSAATDLRGTAEQRLRGNYYGAFVDDVWKATSKLTVTLGVRYDYGAPLVDTQGRQGTLDVVNSTPTKTVWLIDQSAKPAVDLSTSPATVQRVRDGIFQPDHRNLAPRVGLAYRISSNTAVRSGYGIFYDFNQSNVQDTQDIMGQWPFGFPFITAPNLNQPTAANPTPQFVLGSGVFPPFVPGATPPSSPGFAAARDNRRPYVQVWDLGIEQSVSGGWLFSATYVGSKGTHTIITPVVNIAPTPGSGNPQNRVALPQFSPIEVTGAWGNSSYQSAQIKIQKRMGHGLNFLSSYTWSKSIDYQSAAHGSAQPGEGIQNGLNFAADRAASDYDLRHNFVFSGIYDLPFGEGHRFSSGHSGMNRYLLNGWKIDGIVSLHTGFPFNLYVPFDNANTGSGTLGSTERPSLVGQLLPSGFNRSLSAWFNTSAVAAIPYTYGNLGRNVLRQDGLKNVDFSIAKEIPIRENQRIEFRSEFFNLFNHPNFAAPDGNISDATFGQVLSAGNPRFIQFGLKYVF
jgi:carboxypeptidase family protein